MVSGMRTARMTPMSSESSLPPSDPLAPLEQIGLRPGVPGTTRTPDAEELLEAVRGGSLDRVRALLDAGVDPSVRVCTHGIWCSGNEFVTPLMEAGVTPGSEDIVKLLLSRGGDPRARREKRVDVGYDDFKWEGTGEYETAVDLARAAGLHDLAALLEAAARD